jgi:malonate-semialdehyde dehydrogenase (acetylating) / methylmalonate-semialdehyde dehydrogenase
MAAPFVWMHLADCKKFMWCGMPVYGEEALRFYTKQKSVMQRWSAGTAAGAEFVMPTAR